MKRFGVLLLLTAGAPAQSVMPVPAEAIAAELASGDAVRVAKAAAAARTHTAKELDRSLVAALLGWAKRDDEQAVFARLFLLDAMIARRTRVPGDVLEPLLAEPECSTAAFVLLCQAPRQNEQILLQHFLAREEDDLQRQALGNLLAGNRTPGFAARIWDNAKMRPILLVANASSGRKSRRITPSVALEPVEGPAGLPPIPHFVLCDSTGDGLVLLARGPTPVAYRRTVGDESAPRSYPISRVPYAMELEWLETMAETRQQVDTDARIRFSTPEAYVQDATVARDRLLDQRRGLLRGLVAHAAMTAAESAACNVFEVVIHDGREGVNTALPALPPPPRTAEQLVSELASDDARTVAWAADQARTNPDRVLDRALRVALVSWAKRTGEAAAVRLFLLDAMIARGIEAPGELLAPMLDEPMAHGAALVLACRAPLPSERLLFDRFRAGKDTGCWREAEGNLLAANRAPGFAALLWQDAKTQPRITVDVLVPSGFDVGLGFCGPAALAAPAGFPRTPYYLAESGDRPGAVAIVPGPFAVAFVRTNADAVATAISLPSIVPPTRELAWLEAMAGLPSDGGAEVALHFTTPETFRTEAAAARDRLLARRRALHAALVQSQALTAAEAALCTIPDAVEIVDARSDRSTPLPALPPAAR